MSECKHGSKEAECGLCDDDIVNEGIAAAQSGIAATESPYAFCKTRYWETLDYVGFNAERWKLDAWMRGWVDETQRRRNAQKAKTHI